MRVSKTQIEVVTLAKGVQLEFTEDELRKLMHFIKCRNQKEACAVVSSGGYKVCEEFVDELAAVIERARIW